MKVLLVLMLLSINTVFAADQVLTGQTITSSKINEIIQEISTLQTKVTELARSQYIRYDGYASINGNDIRFATRQVNIDNEGNDSSILFTDSSDASGTRITAVGLSYFDINASLYSNNTAIQTIVDRYDSSGTLMESSSSYLQTGASTARIHSKVSIVYRMNAGDYVIVKATHATIEDTSTATYIQIKAVPIL